MCDGKLWAKLGFVMFFVTVALTYGTMSLIDNHKHDVNDNGEQKRLNTTDIPVVETTEQPNSLTEPNTVTETLRESLIFPVELPVHGRRIVNSTEMRNRIIEDDVYINGVSLRSVIEAEFDVKLGRVSGWFRAGQKALIQLTSRRLTIVMWPKVNLTIPRKRIWDMRRFLLLDGMDNYYRVHLKLAYIYPDETLEYLLR